ncbi:hypothetical protein AXF14_03630 [Actinomyces radicidentis]|uniref:Uncharacterized protein n=1 Tax=Actinomyces radicidentis TaxID=111015 RepID=A0A120KME8_ACTRD|nr:hypothetical protein [Actinomyces radicidentis]AMD86854.1 hypothetical protein AXF14_03630 [Actinomyces radicidentis]
MPHALGIDVDDDLLRRWDAWFAPAEQPFHVSSLSAEHRALVPDGPEPRLSPEHRDTFLVYSSGWRLLDEPTFMALPTAARRALVRTRTSELRPVTWPSTPAAERRRRLMRYVEIGVRPSRHAEVAAASWWRCAAVLPGARRLAGTFPGGSGPNCFGTVMAAAGVAGAEHEWMHQPPFEAWLADASRPVTGTAHDDEAGVVLVWRDATGLAQHAAVTLGDGWALSKPSQAWCSPRAVWSVREAILAARYPGLRLERHRLP